METCHFSDELMIDLKPDCHLKVWRKANESGDSIV